MKILVCTCIIYYIIIYSDDEDLSMYMYKDLDGEVVGKLPGQLKGEDFVISDCKVHDYMWILCNTYTAKL